ncbi:helix-turn-helix domain-containing protein [Bacillus sp. FJAT-47783]|uniref:helix-turn-helix domain-containing protein n=1 Tax=Bacillus sp. FJAT-47783 TaxID=2922712 RepID=UPI001FADE9B0
MSHSFFNIITLFLIKKFRHERTISAVYHLLKGKRSSQTIQDGIIFHVSNFFGLFPTLNRQTLMDSIEYLKKNAFIEKIEQNQYCLTKVGDNELFEQLKKSPIPQSLNGWTYSNETGLFWNRFALLVQTLSNLSYGHKNYIPLSQQLDVLQFVKTYIFSLPYTKQQLVNELYKELHHLLKNKHEKDAQIFMYRLTGYKRIGMTNEQIANKMNEDSTYIYIRFVATIHYILMTIQEKPVQFPIIAGIMNGQIKKHTLTASTQLTYSYWQKGYNIDEIAQIRNLKHSTIEDHFVEIALNVPNFNVSSFLHQDDIEKIWRKMRELKTSKLRIIKESLQNQYSYFHIRLAMAIAAKGEA